MHVGNCFTHPLDRVCWCFLGHKQDASKQNAQCLCARRHQLLSPAISDLQFSRDMPRHAEARVNTYLGIFKGTPFSLGIKRVGSKISLPTSSDSLHNLRELKSSHVVHLQARKIEILSPSSPPSFSVRHVCNCKPNSLALQLHIVLTVYKTD